MTEDEAETAAVVADHDRRSADHLRNAIATVTRVIEENRRLAHDFPDHAATAHQRIVEGEQELARFETELAEVEARLASTDATDATTRAGQPSAASRPPERQA